jgi:hypothetical protein
MHYIFLGSMFRMYSIELLKIQSLLLSPVGR